MQTFCVLISTTPQNPTKYDSLKQALDEIGIPTTDFDTNPAFHEIGPGVPYLLAGKKRQLSYLSKKTQNSLPQSLLSELRKQQTLDEGVHPNERTEYLKNCQKAEQGTSEICFEYRLYAPQENNWVYIQDFRVALKNNEGETIGFVGRLSQNYDRTQSIESSATDTWKKVSNSAIRRYLHDFNNTIAGIYSLSELYAQEETDMNSMLEAMAHIRDSSLRAQKIPVKIREIASMSKGPKTYCDLEKIIEEQKELILSILPHGINLSLELSGQSSPVYVEPNAFIQAILHIINNASEAAKKSPKIRIISQPCQISNYGKSTPAIRIEIIDNGSGIESQNINKATEALFTTKDSKKHAGMGLFIVRQFLNEQNGHLNIESSNTNGTNVQITIPIADLNATLEPSTISSTKPESAKPTNSKQRSFTLLIYSWEDIAHSPLLKLMREQGWKYRIHIDPNQVKLDIRDLKDSLDGIIVCHSGLDEHATPLLEELARSTLAKKTAVISMDGSTEILPISIQGKFNFESSIEVKPATQLKRLAKLFS